MQDYGWQSPNERLREFLDRPIFVPSLGHLKAYGCRAYPLTREVKANLERKRKLKLRAYISYLISYDGTNIFRI